MVYGRGGRAALARVLGPYLGVATPVSLTDLLARLSVRGDPRAAYPWYGDVTAGCEGAGGKAGLLFRETMRLVRRALADSAPEADAVVVCDRHGGRRRYAALLMAELEPATLVTERESAAVSSYRLQRRGRPIHIRFVRQADATDKAVALASMAAKYVRELFMEGLNAYFSARVDDLRPTAGYYSDGRRFLRDVEAVLSELDCERDTFVRVS
ncbi:MAG: hypothetical protein ACYTGK_09990 [Planctomycetota bacterium]